MRKTLFWITTFLVLVIINLLIVQKQMVLANGQSVFLRLAPVDPRSLIEGDYMMLRYSNDTLPTNETVSGSDGKLVMKLDENRVATFARIYAGGPLASNEILLRYRKREILRTGRDSYLIQEGTGDIYSTAKYAEMKVDKNGESILVGLRDDQLKQLGPARK